MESINNFWNHFRKNNFVFLLMEEISKEELANFFNELNTLLRLYNKDLNMLIKNGIKKSTLIITANGNPYLFKEVELLVHHAPSIERWKIEAFIQPDEDLEKYIEKRDLPMIYYGISLKKSDMYFSELLNRERPYDINIRIYLKNYIIYKDNNRLREAVFVCLEHLIGEKSFANDLKFIDIVQLTKYEDLIEIHHLGLFIEVLKKDKIIV